MTLILGMFVLFTIALDFTVLISIPTCTGCCSELDGEFLEIAASARHEVVSSAKLK